MFKNRSGVYIAPLITFVAYGRWDGPQLRSAESPMDPRRPGDAVARLRRGRPVRGLGLRKRTRHTRHRRVRMAGPYLSRARRRSAHARIARASAVHLHARDARRAG